MFERTRIEVLFKLGDSSGQIAKQLNRHHSKSVLELEPNT